MKILNEINGYKVYKNGFGELVAYDEYEQLIFPDYEAYHKWLEDEMEE